VNSYCGDIDLIGQQKPQSLARDVVWDRSALELTVQRPLPDGKVDVPRQWGWHDEQRSWSWPGAEGKTLTVRVYTSGERIELKLNGRTLQSKPVTATDRKCVEFTVAYVPGVLKAAAYRNGQQIAHQQLVTVGAPAAIRLTPERKRGAANRGDVSYIAVEIIDAQGRLVPDAAYAVRLSLTGPAELIAFGSASPFASGSLRSAAAQTWNGRALAILRGAGRRGEVRLEAHAQDLSSASSHWEV
jgi:beta-galactosidase